MKIKKSQRSSCIMLVTTTNKNHMEVYAMATMLSQKLVEAQEANDTVRWFIRHFEVGKLLHDCRANKAKGFSVVELITYLICCMFSPIRWCASSRPMKTRSRWRKNVCASSHSSSPFRQLHGYSQEHCAEPAIRNGLSTLPRRATGASGRWGFIC